MEDRGRRKGCDEWLEVDECPSAQGLLELRTDDVLWHEVPRFVVYRHASGAPITDAHRSRMLEQAEDVVSVAAYRQKTNFRGSRAAASQLMEFVSLAKRSGRSVSISTEMYRHSLLASARLMAPTWLIPRTKTG